MEVWRNFFGYGFLVNYILLLFWFVCFVVAKDWMYSLHAKWFQIQNQDFDKIHYMGMALLKIQAFVFWLAPYLAICMVLD